MTREEDNLAYWQTELEKAEYRLEVAKRARRWRTTKQLIVATITLVLLLAAVKIPFLALVGGMFGFMAFLYNGIFAPVRTVADCQEELIETRAKHQYALNQWVAQQ